MKIHLKAKTTHKKTLFVWPEIFYRLYLWMTDFHGAQSVTMCCWWPKSQSLLHQLSSLVLSARLSLIGPFVRWYHRVTCCHQYVWFGGFQSIVGVELKMINFEQLCNAMSWLGSCNGDGLIGSRTARWYSVCVPDI